MRPRKKDRHLPPCVYWKHGTHWYVKAGKWVDIGADLPTALAEYARKVGAPKGGMPALIDEVIEHVKLNLAANTYRQYLGAAKILKRKLAEFSPEQVMSRHVAGIKRDLSPKPNMANRCLSVLRIVFTWAVEWQRVDSNPCIGVKRLPEAKRKRLLSDAEWRAIYDQAGARLKLIMRLQLLTGQRIGDVLRIRRSQIIDAGIAFDQQKTGARLVVRWSPDLRSAVEDALAALGEAQTLTLFRSNTGGPPDYHSVHEQFARAAAAAGVTDARPNDQRAQAATKVRRQGKDATALLGHANASQTETYLRDRDAPEVDGPTLGAQYWTSK